LKKWYTNDLPYTPNLIDLAGVLIDAGLKHEGHELLQQQIEFMFHLYQNPSAYYPYMSRKTVLNSAVNAQLLCEINQLDRKKIDDIASYLNKKDY
jgi:hypothetical protein